MPPKHFFFIVDRLELMKAIRQLKKITGSYYRPCELTLINDQISFYVPGATVALKASTMGSAKASFELKPFHRILNTYKSKELKIEIVDGRVIIDTFSFKASTTFFKNDKVLRSIILPMNYTALDLISILASKRHTIHQLRFNNVLELINDAVQGLNYDLNTAAKALKDYGITREEIELLINEKVTLHLDSNAKASNIKKVLQDKDSTLS